MQLFTTLEEILEASDPTTKIRRFHTLYEAWQRGEAESEKAYRPKRFQTPSYADICTILPAKEHPKRPSLTTPEGKAALLHAIAHIEYSAIDLALDHCYRFQDMPRAYYDDWLGVAADEVRHFRMLEEIMQDLGYRYGSFCVHSFLFDVARRTDTLLERMAVVPRYLEAAGLDASPMVIQKLHRIGDKDALRIVPVLERILEEEVDHVRKGDRWFRWACAREERDPSEYYAIVRRFLPDATKRRPFVNVSGRKAAGFSCEEIRILTSQPCEDQQ